MAVLDAGPVRSSWTDDRHARPVPVTGITGAIGGSLHRTTGGTTMTALHILLLACAAGLLAAVAAGHESLRRLERELPLMGGIVGGALVLGNAACLLPSAPRWYQVTMVALTVAGIVWFLISAATAARNGGCDHDLVPVTARVPGGRTLGGADLRPARPRLQIVPSGTTPAPGLSCDATGATPRVGRRRTEGEAPVATQETFAAAGPSRFATGPTYVAARIDTYVDARRTRVAHGTHVRRSHSTMDPTERFLRLAEAYQLDRRPRSLGRSALS